MPIAVKWLNVLPSERTALRLMPTSRNTLFVAAVEQREAAFGCEAVVNHSFRYVRHTALAGLTTASQPNAASRCSTAATTRNLRLPGEGQDGIYRSRYGLTDWHWALRLGFARCLLCVEQGRMVADSYADVASLVRAAREVRWTVADSKNVEGQFHEPH